MQVETQDYLDLVESANKICFFDIESNSLKGDYGSIICVSIKPYGLSPVTYSIKQLGNDKRVVREAADHLASFPVRVSYYGKGFDSKMLNTRLLKWGYNPLEKRLHIDMYYTLKAHLNTARRSQGHLLGWLGTPEQKMSVSADAWSEMGFKLDEHLPIMIDRCESDVAGLEGLYKRTRHLIGDIARGY